MEPNRLWVYRQLLQESRAAGRVLHAGLKVEVQGFGLFSHLRPDLLFRLCVNNECIY